MRKGTEPRHFIESKGLLQCIREWFVVFDLKICETRVGTTATCRTNAPPVQNTLLPLYSAAEKGWPV
jgi:hypothetical protein